MPRFLGFLFFLISINSFSQDLIGHLFQGAVTFDRYEEVSCKLTIKNTGIVAVDKSAYTYLYFSADETLDDSDKRITYNYSYEVQPNGGTYELNFTYTVTALPGTYYLLFNIDEGKSVQETDDENNVFVVEGVTVNTENIDWYFESLTIDSSHYYPNPFPLPEDPADTIFHHYSRISPQFVIRNAGSTNTGIYVGVDYFLSKDQVLDSNDFLYGSGDFHSGSDNDDVITYLQWMDWSRPFLFPSSLPPGNYYIIGKIDNDNEIQETDETNNIFITQSITVGKSNVDLEIANIDYAYATTSGSIDITFNMSNNGFTSAGGFSIGFYLSRDAVLDYDDYVIGYGNGLYEYYAEAQTTNNLNRFFPYMYSTPPPGAYFVIMVVNEDHAVTETDYSNNTFISTEPSVNIEPPPVPAVTLISATQKGTYDNTDNAFSFTATLSNTGDPVSYWTWFDFVFKDENGLIVADKSELYDIILLNNETKQYNWTVTLSTPLPYGTYTVEINCSQDWFESGPFSTTLTVEEPTYTISGIIQGEDAIPINYGKLFLYQKHDDGKVSFINKTLFTDANNFSFETDHHQHTLFYIPNPVTYPQYAPTILGKTVVLKDFCFFNLTQDTDTVFEILRVTPLPLGTKTVSGNIHVEAPHAGRMARPSGAQRIAQLGEEIEGFPVVLLSDTGDPVKVTMADSNGYYEFTGLPDDEYELVVALELDQPVMQEPISVDVRNSDAIIDFGIGQEVTIPELFYKQQITFNTFPVKTFGDAPFTADLSISSNLSITLTSSDPSVAIIKDGKIEIVGAGKTIITAIQEGEGQFLPATPVQRELVVGKATQTINIPDLPVKTYGDNGFELTATSSSGLPVFYTSSNKNVATVTNGKVTIVGAGTTTIKAIQKGDNNYLPADVIERTLVVNKVNESLVVNDIPEKTFGNPAFGLSVETTSTRPVLIASSNNSIAKYNNGKIHIYGAGTVNIEVKIDANENFSGATVTKQLVIKKANQGIDFKELPEVDIEQQTLVLEARSSAFLPVSFQSDNEAIATVSGNEVHFHDAGIVNIIATQNGNQNYNAATPVTRELRVNVVSSVESGYNTAVTVYPNPVVDRLNVKSAYGIESLTITDVLGHEVKAFTSKDSLLDLSGLASGIYYLKVTTVKSQNVLRINKQ